MPVTPDLRALSTLGVKRAGLGLPDPTATAAHSFAASAAATSILSASLLDGSDLDGMDHKACLLYTSDAADE